MQTMCHRFRFRNAHKTWLSRRAASTEYGPYALKKSNAQKLVRKYMRRTISGWKTLKIRGKQQVTVGI
jgi:hypothetical protein